MPVKGDYFPTVDFPTKEEIDGSNPFHFSNLSCFDASITTSFSQNSSSTHELLLENSELFNQKLYDLWEFSGRHPIGTTGEIALELHALYKEVTGRGGLDKVTKGGTWEEVASALNFTGGVDDPFLLQEYYVEHLYDFEEMYFLGTRREPAAPVGDPGFHIGNIVTGEIYTKFDGGYLVTVAVGSEKFSGLLYHFEECVAEQFAVIPGQMVDIGLVSDSKPVGLTFQVGCSKGKQSQVTKSKPMKKVTKERRRTRNAYEIFFHEQYDRLKNNPQGNIRKIVIAAWKCLSKSERLPYIEKSLKDREEHKESGLDTLRKPRNAYQIFLCEQCDQLKNMQRTTERNIKEKVRDAWKHLSESDRLPYIEQSTKEKEKEKERINREMAAYNEQQKMQSRSEYQPCLPETSTGDYHVSLETGSAANEILLPDKPMDPFNACLMEIANQLHQQMDWDFYGHFDMSI